MLTDAGGGGANGGGSGSRPVGPLPPLPLEAWEPTKQTLHRWLQIVGKVRLAAAPPRNHWWHAPLYPTTRGLTTGPMPLPPADAVGGVAFAIDLDLIEHRLLVTRSDGAVDAFALPGLSVAGFYRELFARLAGLGVVVDIRAVPYALAPAEPFAADVAHASYDAELVARWWRIVLWSALVFEEFAGRFVGKTSPVHLFWHSFDLAVTRFSGRPAPVGDGADPVSREAYSHEVISFGFWPGDDRVRRPAFYAYAAPEPPGLRERPLRPAAAAWTDTGRGSLAVLAYDDLRRRPDPKDALLDFLESAYRAAAEVAGWDETALAAPARQRPTRATTNHS